jgi:pSer/pThr/pTyr-binding forkhead associated (FHA) protein
MKKCNADDHPYCTHRAQEGELVCAVGHLQKIMADEPNYAHKPLPTYAELTTPFPNSTVGSGLHLHFSGYDPRAAGGRQMLRLELRGIPGQIPLQNITQIDVQLRSDLIAANLSKHRFTRTLSGQWRPLLIAFSSKNKEYGQYQMEVTLSHLIADICQRRWTCSTIILVPPADTSLTEIHRVFLASHKNVRVLADDGSIAKLSGLNGYSHGNMDIEISARNAALSQVELSAPMGKNEIAMGTIAWDEELIEEAIEEPLAIVPAKLAVKAIAAPPLNSIFHTSTTNSASLISKEAKIRLLALDSWVLGRLEWQRPSADILLAHRGLSATENAKLTRRISARHALICRTGEGAEIIDVSRYGVLLDGVALEKNLATPLKPGMQIELCASMKGIVNLRVKIILPHLIILQRTAGESEFLYLLTPETKPGYLSQTLPVALPDSLPQLFHRDGSFWHIDPLTKHESMLGPSASLSGMQHIPRGSCYHNEAYEGVRGFGAWRSLPPAPFITNAIVTT